MSKTRLIPYARINLRASISLYSWLKMDKIYQKLIISINEHSSSIGFLGELR